MSKIVCEICGTSYAESASQCPICGSTKSPTAEHENPASNGGYTYVKGGRFSKANVRKRNRGKHVAQVTHTAKSNKMKKADGGNRGLVITAVVLMVAVIAVVGYIAFRFFFPAEVGGSANVEQTIPCTSITAEFTEITLDEIGATAQLVVTAMPENTTDKINFCPSDISIAKVSAEGLVEAVGPGVTTIIVQCGEQQVLVTVICDIVEETEPPTETEPITISLLYKELVLKSEGAEYSIYAGEIDAAQITWISEDTTVATIENGVVKAVGEGETVVHAEFNGAKASCTIKCEFTVEDDVISGSGNVGEDTGDQPTEETESTEPTTPGTTYAIYTLWNTELTDFSIKNGEKLVLVVKDSNGNKVDAIFSVSNADICTVEGNTLIGLPTCSGKRGTLTATVNGVTVTCIIRGS